MRNRNAELMKKLIKAYTSFTRMERMGIVCLSGLIVLLLIFRISMPYWVHPKTNPEKDKRLIAAWEAYKSKQTANTEDSTGDDGNEYTDNGTSTLPDVININTADSATLVRLKGIGPATASKILDRIRKKGPFKNIDQLKEVRSFPEETLEILKKHLAVSDSGKIK
jgi:competence ComEA-like helix-hairpin-helix protein